MIPAYPGSSLRASLGSSLRAALAAFALVAWLRAAPPQAAWTLDTVPSASRTVVVVVYGRGFDHDPPACRGLARVLVDARVLAASRAVAARHTGAQVYGDLAVAFGEVAPAEAARFAAALLGDANSLLDRDLERLLARAALAADDAAWLYPGQVLETRLREALWGSEVAAPPCGDARALHVATVAEVRAALRQDVAMRGSVFGASPVGDLPALPACPWPVLPAVGRPGAVAAGMAHSLHSRLDGPYVGVAFAIPADLEPAVLAMAMEVARSRAARRLPLRGSEAAARGPVVGWTWRAGGSLAWFCRRGRPGGGAAAQAELAELLADLRQRPPTPRELATAAAALAGETAAPGAGGQVGDLVGRALAVVLARARGLEGVEWRNIEAEPVAAALVRLLDDERSAWAQLSPVERRQPPRR